MTNEDRVAIAISFVLIIIINIFGFTILINESKLDKQKIDYSLQLNNNQIIIIDKHNNSNIIELDSLEEFIIQDNK